MAKCDVTYKCGHKETLNIFGNPRDIEWKILGLQKCICHNCYLKQSIKKCEIIANAKGITIPEIVKGKGWNGRIYGKQGNYSIYLDGEKVNISDEESVMLSEYIHNCV